ncbi:MAG TPA: redoxin domain-containing protein, partial [Anaerolineaceae bacterium]|nr:redoxin domain-containing protein [Anaerolineaceae bacterium]
MAQLRDASDEYAKSDTMVLIVAPEPPEAFQEMWKTENIPFVGLPDQGFSVQKTYGKQAGLFKLGRVPTQVLIDKQGIIRYVHFGHAPS